MFSMVWLKFSSIESISQSAFDKTCYRFITFDSYIIFKFVEISKFKVFLHRACIILIYVAVIVVDFQTVLISSLFFLFDYWTIGIK